MKFVAVVRATVVLENVLPLCAANAREPRTSKPEFLMYLLRISGKTNEVRVRWPFQVMLFKFTVC